MRIIFEEIAIKRTKRWVDENGRKRQMTKKFYQTISPFNHKNGLVKNRKQILKELEKEASIWLEQMR